MIYSKPGGSNLSVKDRIRAFESRQDKNDVKLRHDAGKPKRKKPSSKAFEEFESQGILIGFGNVPKKRHTEYYGDSPLPDDQDDYPGADDNRRAHFASDPQLTHRSPSPPEDPDDDFAAVQRNCDILKSFRRAPPPKNRSRARRSGRRRGHSSDGGESEAKIEEEMGGRLNGKSSPESPEETDAGDMDQDGREEFEQSLHMPSPIKQRSLPEEELNNQSLQWEGDTSNRPHPQGMASNYKASGVARSQSTPNQRHAEYTGDSGNMNGFHPRLDNLDGAARESNRRRTQSDSSERETKIKRPVSYHSSSAVHRDYGSSDILGGGELMGRDYITHKPPRPPFHRDRPITSSGGGPHSSLSRNHSSPVVRVTPQLRLPDSAPSMRRWESEHAGLDTSEAGGGVMSDGGGFPMDQQPQMHPHWLQENGHMVDPYTPRTDKIERKFRHDMVDLPPPTQPRSERLNRKMIVASPLAPNLLYRPYYQSDKPVPADSLTNVYRNYPPAMNGERDMNGAHMSGPPLNTRVVVKFNIDTEPTNV